MYLDRVIENGRTNLAGLKKGHLFQDFFLFPDMLYFLPFLGCKAQAWQPIKIQNFVVVSYLNFWELSGIRQAVFR